MGDTDLNDWFRGLCSTERIGKKWWKCLFFWVCDTTMINAFILHTWCWKHFNPGKRYRVTLAKFIRMVCNHYKPQTGSPTRHRHRYAVSKKRRTPDEQSSYRGPAGEDRRPHPNQKCPGNVPMERTDLYTTGKKAGLHKQGQCRYCWNACSDRKVRVSSSYLCSLCKVILCRQCMAPYHAWVME